MKAYVSLEKVLAVFDDIHPLDHNANAYLSQIKEIPVADVVAVVRCGNCKNCEERYDTDGNAPYWVCKEWECGTDYDGYCHYGELNKVVDK